MATDLLEEVVDDCVSSDVNPLAEVREIIARAVASHGSDVGASVDMAMSEIVELDAIESIKEALLATAVRRLIHIERCRVNHRITHGRRDDEEGDRSSTVFAEPGATVNAAVDSATKRAPNPARRQDFSSLKDAYAESYFDYKICGKALRDAGIDDVRDMHEKSKAQRIGGHRNELWTAEILKRMKPGKSVPQSMSERTIERLYKEAQRRAADGVDGSEPAAR